MNKKYIERLSSLLRDIEIDLGATDLSILCLEALHDTLSSIHPRSLHDFDTQLVNIVEDIQNTQPRYAIVIDGFMELLNLVHQEDDKQNNKNYDQNKEKFLKYISNLIASHKNIQDELAKQAEKLNLDGKTILIFHHSNTLEKVLLSAKKRKQKFQVIVAEQDQEKTGANIDFLHNNKFDYKVVPSYMISHLASEIDLLLLGALTLNSNMQFVTDTGTNALISQFYLLKTPIYMLLTSQKFSLWKSTSEHDSQDIFSHSHTRKHHCKKIDFKRIKFSHDRVDLNLLTKVITERGIFSPEQVKSCFKNRLAKRLEINKKLAKKKK